MAIIKRQEMSEGLGYGETQTLLHCLWRDKWYSHWRAQYGSYSQKIENKIMIQKSYLWLKISKEMKWECWKDTHIHLLHCLHLFPQQQINKCPCDKWMHKESNEYIHAMVYYSVFLKRKILTLQQYGWTWRTLRWGKIKGIHQWTNSTWFHLYEIFKTGKLTETE